MSSRNFRNVSSNIHLLSWKLYFPLYSLSDFELQFTSGIYATHIVRPLGLINIMSYLIQLPFSDSLVLDNIVPHRSNTDPP